MKFVLDRYEMWKQGVLVDADSPEEALEKATRGEGEDIDEWMTLHGGMVPFYLNAVPFDPEKHELPEDHPYQKYMVPSNVINLATTDHDIEDTVEILKRQLCEDNNE